MVKIKISKQAQKDMRRIYNYVSEDSVQNAEMLMEKFISKIDSLAKYPERGKIIKRNFKSFGKRNPGLQIQNYLQTVFKNSANYYHTSFFTFDD